MPDSHDGVIMELLIIRHGQSEHNISYEGTLDSSLTKKGNEQVHNTACWLRDNFDLSGYKGVSSPYLRTLQTSYILRSQTDINFEVNELVREYHIKKDEPELLENQGMPIKFRENLFNDFDWSRWDGKDGKNGVPEDLKIYSNETMDDFLGRVEFYTKGLNEDSRYLIVGHGASCRALHDISTNKDLKDIKDRYRKPVKEYKDSIENSSLIWIKDGECKWFSKVVW